MGTTKSQRQSAYQVVELCAGAGGQALGLERAGFIHSLAVELDENASRSLLTNRPLWDVRMGDVADPRVWIPSDFQGIDLLAGGVPCPPFSVAGQQLGASDERDLFAWAVEQVSVIRPRALMLENVRGLSTPRFAPYRQRILDRLASLGYEPFWKLLNACDYSVPQLRPRFVLVALRSDDAPYFSWPSPTADAPSVGAALHDLMATNDWQHADAWSAIASGIAPTIVGGSKKHGGADLGPTRAKAAWLRLGVDGKGIANEPPSRRDPHPSDTPPRLTIDMVKRLQGWSGEEWELTGGKTAQYRQIGNAFPPPVAEAVGRSILRAFDRVERTNTIDVHRITDPIFDLLQRHPEGVTEYSLLQEVPSLTVSDLNRWLTRISLDFDIEVKPTGSQRIIRLGDFRGFVGQENHARHDFIAQRRSRVS